MQTETRFSKKTIEFLKLAGEQKNPLWLDEYAEEHQAYLVSPLRAFAEHLSAELGGMSEAKGYKFPKRGFGRLRRPSHKVAPGEIAYRNWVHVQAAKPSKSRFDDNPSLYFYMSPDSVFVSGGLYEPSSRQIKQIRAWIAQDPEDLVAVLKSRSFKKEFPNGLETKKSVKTFPRSYPQDHPRIEWLKLQAYYTKFDFTKKELYSAEFRDIVCEKWRQALRLNRAILTALETDPWDLGLALMQGPVEEPIEEVGTDLWDDRL